MAFYEGFNPQLKSMQGAPTDADPQTPHVNAEALALLFRPTSAVYRPTDKADARVWLVADEPVPVLHSTGRTPAPYKGGIGPDAPELGRQIRLLGPEASMLWQSFLQNYNDRSQESVIPKDLPLNEIDAKFQGKTQWFGPYADSELSYVGTKIAPIQPEIRDLKQFADTTPGSSKVPGHIYAVGMAAGTQTPAEILEYESRAGQAVKYFGQYQFEYTKTADGGLQVDISQWKPVSANFEPVKKEIAGKMHALNGLTEYKFDKDGHLTSAAEYVASPDNMPSALNGNNPRPVNTNKPIISLQFDGNGHATDGNSHLPITDWNLTLAAPKFMYFDLFGPKRS
jgi:hypothetical protein